MDLFTNLTDDQWALLGCFAAVVVSATIMSLSFYIGPARHAPQRTAGRLPHVERVKRQSPADDPERRAA